jgi:hypothetical protein
MSSIEGLSLEEAAKLAMCLEGAAYYCTSGRYTHFTNENGYEVSLFKTFGDDSPSWFGNKSSEHSWVYYKHDDQELKPITELITQEEPST